MEYKFDRVAPEGFSAKGLGLHSGWRRTDNAERIDSHLSVWD